MDLLRIRLIFGIHSMSVLCMQGFLEKYNPTERRRGDFFENPQGLDLAGGKERSLHLPTN